MSDEYIAGRNSVLEALRAGRTLNKLIVAAGDRQGSIKEIIAIARSQGLTIQETEASRLDALVPGIRHQGVLALAAPVAYSEWEDIEERTAAAGEAPFVVLLDEINDPHNTGAIIRTADAAGVHGVLLPKRRSCPLTAAVAKTSAGAVEHVPVVRIGNIVQELNELKKKGLWVIGADMDGSDLCYEADLTGPVVLVIGSEGSGMGRLVKEACDRVVRIPMYGKINSLNASVASALLMYEIRRQRELAKR